MFLREMPEPLMTFPLYDDWLKTFNLPTEQWTNHLRSLVMKLPQANRILLERLIGLCVDVTKFTQQNLMTEQNLAIVLTPSILCSSDENPLSLIQDLETCNLVVVLLIREFEEILVGTSDLTPIFFPLHLTGTEVLAEAPTQLLTPTSQEITQVVTSTALTTDTVPIKQDLSLDLLQVQTQTQIQVQDSTVDMTQPPTSQLPPLPFQTPPVFSTKRVAIRPSTRPTLSEIETQSDAQYDLSSERHKAVLKQQQLLAQPQIHRVRAQTQPRAPTTRTKPQAPLQKETEIQKPTIRLQPQMQPPQSPLPLQLPQNPPPLQSPPQSPLPQPPNPQTRQQENTLEPILHQLEELQNPKQKRQQHIQAIRRLYGTQEALLVLQRHSCALGSLDDGLLSLSSTNFFTPSPLTSDETTSVTMPSPEEFCQSRAQISHSIGVSLEEYSQAEIELTIVAERNKQRRISMLLTNSVT
eukprot:TRINITY_DN8023_c0_g1_i5.p1 TRINITY_DN8023_c0_g1~~TRINITY_DN8023_c0_g1_i5.p1  ORF type:complete len:467 (-),score=100.01 TRINITY_DN8023_c0_g1_i5:157-1557(-)